jgi:UDP-N-acetylmuramoylalanine--D-glutamate ligase
LLAESELQLPGEHNVANALCVLALAAPLGIGFSQLCDGLVAYAGLPHRTQFIGEKNGVRWYNDSKGTNVDACRKAVLAMPGPVMLIAGGISKGADFTLLAETLERCVKLLILIGQDREQMANQMSSVSEIVMADTLREAVFVASDRANPGDVVLLSPACSSFDMFRNFEDRGDQFVTAVQEVLAA